MKAGSRLKGEADEIKGSPEIRKAYLGI